MFGCGVVLKVLSVVGAVRSFNGHSSSDNQMQLLPFDKRGGFVWVKGRVLGTKIEHATWHGYAVVGLWCYRRDACI